MLGVSIQKFQIQFLATLYLADIFWTHHIFILSSAMNWVFSSDIRVVTAGKSPPVYSAVWE